MLSETIAYKRLMHEAERSAILDRIRSEGLAEIFFYNLPRGHVERDAWIKVTAPTEHQFLAVSEDFMGNYLGAAVFREHSYRMWSFDFVAFRMGFDRAIRQARGAFQWLFETTDAQAIQGVTPVTHRHALRLAEACGVCAKVRIPQACYIARRDRWVDGIYHIITRDSLEKEEN